jgi:hypothetical protein
MNITRFAVSAAVVGVLGSTMVFAQTANPPQSTTSPSSASSPSQRDSTRSTTDTAETPATAGAQPSDAATPHQREAMAGKTQTMKECMDERAARNDGMSKADMTKACNDQIKMQKERAHLSKAPTSTSKDSASQPAPSPK